MAKSEFLRSLFNASLTAIFPSKAHFINELREIINETDSRKIYGKVGGSTTSATDPTLTAEQKQQAFTQL